MEKPSLRLLPCPCLAARRMTIRQSIPSCRLRPHQAGKDADTRAGRERHQGVTPEQSLEFWRGLRTIGTSTQLVVYPGEGHNLNKKDSNDTLRRSAEWFAKYMPASSGNMHPD